MAEDEVRLTVGDVGRWLVLALLVLLGIVLFFRFAPSTQPVVHPPAATAERP